MRDQRERMRETDENREGVVSLELARRNEIHKLLEEYHILLCL